MVFKYGYAIDEQVGNLTMTTGRIITPQKVPDTIVLSMVNSSRFLILGTKPEILEWLRTYSNVRLDVSLFDDPSFAPHVSIPDVVVDLLPSYDEAAQAPFLEYINPLHHPDPASEPARLEFRPVNNKIDDHIEPVFRVIVRRGSTFGDIVDNIQAKWDAVIHPSMWDNVKQIASLPSQYFSEDQYADDQPSTTSPSKEMTTTPLSSVVIDH